MCDLIQALNGLTWPAAFAIAVIAIACAFIGYSYFRSFWFRSF